MNSETAQQLFEKLYFASTEAEVDKVISIFSETLEDPNNWLPLDDNEGNFGIIENQQSSPIGVSGAVKMR